VTKPTNKYGPQERYHKKNRVDYKMPCMRSTEQDIIDWLESQPNKSGYIKQLIRADMEQQKNK